MKNKMQVMLNENNHCNGVEYTAILIFKRLDYNRVLSSKAYSNWMMAPIQCKQKYYNEMVLINEDIKSNLKELTKLQW